MRICHSWIFFSTISGSLRSPFPFLRQVSSENRLGPGSCERGMGAVVGGSSIITVGQYSRSIFVKQPLSMMVLSRTPVYLPPEYDIVNSRDKVNLHVFGANWQIAATQTGRWYSHDALRIWFVWLFLVEKADTGRGKLWFIRNESGNGNLISVELVTFLVLIEYLKNWFCAYIY